MGLCVKMKLALAILLVVCLVSVGGNVFFLLKNSDLDFQVNEAKNLSENVQRELDRNLEEREGLIEATQKAEEESTLYFSENTKLKQEQGQIEKELSQSKENGEKSELELKKTSEKLQALEKELSDNVTGQRDKAVRVESLKERLVLLERKLSNERGIYYYNLSVAYTKAKLHDKAIEAYLKSLEINPGNPEAHYNLGLLYDKVKNKPEKAVIHYKKYLEIEPYAEDKEEVMKLIKKLEVGGNQWKERSF